MSSYAHYLLTGVCHAELIYRDVHDVAILDCDIPLTVATIASRTTSDVYCSALCAILTSCAAARIASPHATTYGWDIGCRLQGICRSECVNEWISKHLNDYIKPEERFDTSWHIHELLKKNHEWMNE